MFLREQRPILSCADCGSHLIEVRGPVTDRALVRCARCGAGATHWAHFISDLGSRIDRQEHERKRRLH